MKYIGQHDFTDETDIMLATLACHPDGYKRNVYKNLWNLLHLLTRNISR